MADEKNTWAEIASAHVRDVRQLMDSDLSSMPIERQIFEVDQFARHAHVVLNIVLLKLAAEDSRT